MHRTRRAALAVALALLAPLLLAVPAHADDLAWAVSTADNANGTGRANYSYALAPGATVTDALVVRNSGTSALSLRVYAADGFTTSSGQLDLLPAGRQSTDLGTWVVADRDHLDLKPGESATVSFTLTVPASATPGDHTGGIVTSYSDATSGSTVAIDRRLGSRIHVRVAGALTPAAEVRNVTVTVPPSLNPFAPVTAVVRYELSNTGNARIFGHETVTVTGPGGLLRRAVSAETPEVVPGSTLDRTVTLTGVWALFALTARVEVTPEAVGGDRAELVSEVASTTAVPWGALGVLLVLVAAGVGVGIWNHRRGWEWVEADEEPTTSA